MNKSSLIQRRVLSTVAVLGMLVASLVLTGSVAAEGAPFNTVPGYPLEGCYGAVTAGTGMWDGTGNIILDVPGPIVDAFLWWAGADWGGADELIINGTPVVGTLIDSTPTVLSHPDWYLWRADVSGFVGEGANTLAIESWEGSADSWSWRNGATLAVVYERDPACLDPVEIQLYEGLDWFWYYSQTQFASEVEAYFFEPAPFDRTFGVTFSYAGANHEDGDCRDGTIWYASGTGAAPAQLLEKVWPSTYGVNGGQLVADAPFSPEPPCTPAIYPPATNLEGGFIDAEWSVATLDVTVPAGAEWIAFQMESEEFRDGELIQGESGSWVGNVLEVPLPTPDVTVTKDDGVMSAEPGDTLTYLINYANIGDRYANDVLIVDTIPERTSYVDCYIPFGTCSEAGGVVTFELGTVDAGASGTVQVTVELDPIYPCGDTPITNEVTISTSTPGDDPSNNADEDTDIVTAYVTVDIEKSAAPEPVEAGGQLSYTLDWTVGGNCWAENTTITDAVPPLTTFVSCEPAADCSESGGTVTWNLGQVTPPDSGTATFVVDVDTCLPDGTLIDNTAAIFEDSGEYDEDTVTSTVHSDHELDIDKVGDPKPVMKNDPLTYTILWEITGNEPAPNVIITDLVPDGTTFDSATGGGVHDPVTGVVTWNLGDFCPPANGGVSFTVIVDRDLVDPAEISNTAVICDDDAGTDCAEDQDITPVIFTSEIGDFVWLDENGDTVQDPGEAGMPGVVLNLYDAGADGVCGTVDDTWLDTRTTDSAGAYMFDLLLEGDYCVDVDDTTLLPDLYLSPGLTDPHGPIALDPELDPDEQYLDADFGYYPGGSIGDFVWLDEDRDGEQDAGEAGIADVAVNLLDAGADGLCDTADDVLLDSGVTDADGLYIFDPLPIGTYCVGVDESTVPVGLNLSFGIQEPHGPINLGAWEDYLNADFGYAWPEIVITKAVDKEYVHRHEDLTFTVTVSSEGPGPADGVVVTDEISEYLEYIRLNTTQGMAVWNSGTRTVTAHIGWLNEGEEVTITITGRVIDIPTADLPKTIYDMAVVDFTGGPGPEESNETVTEVVYFAPGEIPEPSTMLLMGSGLLSLAGYAQLQLRRRRREEE